MNTIKYTVARMFKDIDGSVRIPGKDTVDVTPERAQILRRAGVIGNIVREEVTRALPGARKVEVATKKKNVETATKKKAVETATKKQKDESRDFI